MGKLTGGSTDYYKIPPGATNKPAGGRQMKEDKYKNGCESLYNLNENLVKQNRKLREVLQYYATVEMRDIVMIDKGKQARDILKRT